jgi:hypothetical protein
VCGEDDAGDVDVFGLSVLCCVMCFSLCVVCACCVFDIPFLKENSLCVPHC